MGTSEQAKKDINDFYSFLNEFGIPFDLVKSQSDNESDYMPIILDKVVLLESKISGIGVFASKLIQNGDEIGNALINGKRTQLGKFINHGIAPNAKFILQRNGDLKVIAINEIRPGSTYESELKVDYRNSIKIAQERICQGQRQQ